MEPVDEVGVTILRELRAHIEHYLKLVAAETGPLSEATLGYWNKTILPIIKTAGKTLGAGHVLSKTEVIYLTGRYTAAELETLAINRTEWAILEHTSSLAASSVARRMLQVTNVVGIMLMTTTQSEAEGMENIWLYEKYVRNYLVCLVKVSALPGKHVCHMQPPMTYKHWKGSVEKRSSGMWWEQQ